MPHKKVKCFISGQEISWSEYLQFTLGPDNYIYCDLDGKLPSKERVYSYNNKELLSANLAKFSEIWPHASLKDGFIVSIEQLFLQKILQYVALANKSGNVDFGKDKITKKIANKKHTQLILQSCNASLQEKFNNKCDNVIVIDVFDEMALSDMCGSKRVTYLLIENRGFINSIMDIYNRYKKFMGI
mgnify:CR=1 FL=1